MTHCSMFTTVSQCVCVSNCISQSACATRSDQHAHDHHVYRGHGHRLRNVLCCGYGCGGSEVNVILTCFTTQKHLTWRQRFRNKCSYSWVKTCENTDEIGVINPKNIKCQSPKSTNHKTN